MAACITATHKPTPRGASHKTEKGIRSKVSSKTTLNLMQNCDLPPPMKLFSGPEDAFLSSISKIYNMGGADHQTSKDSPENDEKLEILKALRLSQTRAREAEKKSMILSKDKIHISNLMVEESVRLLAHRHWVKMLELEVFKMQRELHKFNMEASCEASSWGANWEESCEADDNSSQRWHGAIIFGLAIAGLGFAFGCRYLL